MVFIHNIILFSVNDFFESYITGISIKNKNVEFLKRKFN